MAQYQSGKLDAVAPPGRTVTAPPVATYTPVRMTP